MSRIIEGWLRRGAELCHCVCCLHCPLCKGHKAAALAGNDGLGALGLQHLLDKAMCSCWHRDNAATLIAFSAVPDSIARVIPYLRKQRPTDQLVVWAPCLGLPAAAWVATWPSIFTPLIYLTSTKLREFC